MAFDSSAGDYLTYQGNILKSILSYIPSDDLGELRTVSKEWNRVVTNIRDNREYFQSMVNATKTPLELSVRLKPEQFNVIFATKEILGLLVKQKIGNIHLLNVKEYVKFRFISGRYLPPVVITCHCKFQRDSSKRVAYYYNRKVSFCNLLSHGVRSKSLSVSIFQLNDKFCEKELLSVLEAFKCEPIKSMMVFVKSRVYIPSTFTNLVQSVQSEPFICSGVSGDMRLLLPEVYSQARYDTTIIVFRGSGLKVTSDIFDWGSYEVEDETIQSFIPFLKKLLERAGPVPVDGTRQVYIFECSAVVANVEAIISEVLDLLPNVEIVFIRTGVNEFYRNTADMKRLKKGSDIRGYSTVVNIYDFSGVQKTFHYAPNEPESDYTEEGYEEEESDTSSSG